MSKELYAWWPSRPLPGNFGDILTPLLVKELYGVECKYASKPYKQPTLLGVGSIITHADEQCTIWGSGLISSGGKLNPRAEYLSVRGPLTYEKLKENNINCPPIFGDPALLLPNIFNMHVDKSYEYGIFAHYVDTKMVKTWYRKDSGVGKVLIIDPLNKDPIAVVKEVLKCRNIISSSLHGLIVAHAYGIPAVWVKHSDKLTGDDIKFHDYFASVGLRSECVDFQNRIKVEDFGKFNYQRDINIDVGKIRTALEQYLVRENFRLKT